MTTNSSQIFHQSAAIPIWKEQIVLVTSRSKGRWIVPKGAIEAGYTPQQSAAFEAQEEAGVTGRMLSAEVGRYRFHKWGRDCLMRFYVLEVHNVLQHWPERGQRKRALVSFGDALKMVHKKKLHGVLLNYFNQRQGHG